MKFKKPKSEPKPKPKRNVPFPGPNTILGRLFIHGINHPNDECAWEIIRFHQKIYDVWASRIPKKSLDN